MLSPVRNETSGVGRSAHDQGPPAEAVQLARTPRRWDGRVLANAIAIAGRDLALPSAILPVIRGHALQGSGRYAPRPWLSLSLPCAQRITPASEPVWRGGGRGAARPRRHRLRDPQARGQLGREAEIARSFAMLRTEGALTTQRGPGLRAPASACRSAPSPSRWAPTSVSSSTRRRRGSCTGPRCTSRLPVSVSDSLLPAALVTRPLSLRPPSSAKEELARNSLRR